MPLHCHNIRGREAAIVACARRCRRVVFAAAIVAHVTPICFKLLGVSKGMVKALLTGTLLCLLSQAVVATYHKTYESAFHPVQLRRRSLSSLPSSLGSTVSSFDGSHSPVYEVVSTSYEDDDREADQPAEATQSEEESDDADADDCNLQQEDVDL